MEQLLTNEERRDVTLISFAETILAHVANRNKPKSRRHNQLLAAIERLQRVDNTYHGYLTDSYQAQAEAILAKIEGDLIQLYDGTDEEEEDDGQTELEFQ